jgi:hypothetical protein
MNLRIKQLAEQAGITTNLDTDYYEKDMNKWVDYFSEKFAELIVEECMKLNSKELSITAIERLLPLYEEHFGVEE